MYWPTSRVAFIMALLKECGNTNGLPEDGDGRDLVYCLHGDEKSGYVEEYWYDTGSQENSEILFAFGEVWA